jgi:phosphoribosyl 1,2-cyclic phosphodiesterase
MIGFCPLASGSKGNSIYFGTTETRILIDAGISAGALVKKLAQIHVEIETIQAILITHEHTDHIRGLPLICEKYNIPVLANAETAKGIVQALNFRPRLKIFTTGEPFSFGDLEILPFSIPHDTLDPVGFTIRAMGYKFGFCADLGHVTSLVRKMLEKCHYLYIEANHQPSMVHASHRPPIYKERVLGKQGHLSNEECAGLLMALCHNGLKHIHLAHLSSECNSEELALKIAKEAIKSTNGEVTVSIAYQDRVSDSVSV